MGVSALELADAVADGLSEDLAKGRVLHANHRQLGLVSERQRDLHADEAAPDNDDVLLVVVLLRRADGRVDRLGVLDATHGEDVGEVDAVERELGREGARREDEVVVSRMLAVRELDRRRRKVKLGRLLLKASVPSGRGVVEDRGAQKEEDEPCRE